MPDPGAAAEPAGAGELVQDVDRERVVEIGASVQCTQDSNRVPGLLTGLTIGHAIKVLSETEPGRYTNHLCRDGEGWSGLFDEVERDIGVIRLPRWGRVERAAGVVAWDVLDDGGTPVEPDPSLPD